MSEDKQKYPAALYKDGKAPSHSNDPNPQSDVRFVADEAEEAAAAKDGYVRAGKKSAAKKAAE